MTLFSKRSVARGMAGEDSVLDVGEFSPSQERSVERDLVVHQSNSSAAWLVAATVSFVVVLASYFKIYLGIDFTDESLYSAIPYRFYLGDKPFIDEWNLTQLASLLVYPFYRIFWVIKGSTDGTLLFGRHLVLVFSLLVSLEMFLSLRKMISREWLLLAAALPLTFVPYNLYGPSYNALGGGLFAMGLWVGWDARRRLRNPLSTIAAGIYHGLAVFVYPTLAVAAVGFALFALWSSGRKLRESLSYLVGAALGPLIILATFRVGLSDVVTLLHYVAINGKTTEHHWGLYKIALVASQIWNSTSYKPLLLLTLAVLTWSHFSGKFRLRAAIVFFISVLLFFSNRARVGGDGLMGYLRSFALLAPICFWMVPRTTTRVLLMGGVWLPAVLAGLAMAWSSNMGGAAFAVPILPAAIVCAYFAGLLMVPDSLPKWARVFGVAPLVLLIALVLYGRLGNYMEDDSRDLTAKLLNGPFQGLYTTPAKAAFLSRLSADVAGAKRNSTSILFQPHFPVGYLLTDLRPSAPSLWATCPNEVAAVCYDFYRAKAGPRGLVVNLHKLRYDSNRVDEFHFPKDNPMEKMLHAHHREILATDSYVIYQATTSQE